MVDACINFNLPDIFYCSSEMILEAESCESEKYINQSIIPNNC